MLANSRILPWESVSSVVRVQREPSVLQKRAATFVKRPLPAGRMPKAYEKTAPTSRRAVLSAAGAQKDRATLGGGFLRLEKLRKQVAW